MFYFKISTAKNPNIFKIRKGWQSNASPSYSKVTINQNIHYRRRLDRYY